MTTKTLNQVRDDVAVHLMQFPDHLYMIGPCVGDNIGFAAVRLVPAEPNAIPLRDVSEFTLLGRAGLVHYSHAPLAPADAEASHQLLVVINQVLSEWLFLGAHDRIDSAAPDLIARTMSATEQLRALLGPPTPAAETPFLLVHLDRGPSEYLTFARAEQLVRARWLQLGGDHHDPQPDEIALELKILLDHPDRTLQAQVHPRWILMRAPRVRHLSTTTPPR